MSDRQSRWAPRSRLSSSAPRPVVRVRMLSTGRWRAPQEPAADAGPRTARLIAVGAALPGMGKSVVASNLAVAIAGLGRQVLVVDLDQAAPRQHALFGVPPAAGNPRSTGVRNVRLWPAATELAGVRDPAVRRALVASLGALDADVIIVDLATASRDDLWDFFATGERLLVSTAEPSALAAGYAFLAQAARRAEQRHGVRARAELARFAGGLIGNAAGDADDVEAFHAFGRQVRAELGIPLLPLGCLRRSARIDQSIAAKKPLLARTGIDDDVRQFHQMAELMMAAPDVPERGCALDVATAPGPAPGPALELDRYRRRHPRFEVDWAATLELPGGGPNAVRVRDISESGAAIETTLRVQAGDIGRLHFYQLDGQPVLEVVVKNVVATLNRVGLGFVGGGEIARRVADNGRARLASP